MGQQLDLDLHLTSSRFVNTPQIGDQPTRGVILAEFRPDCFAFGVDDHHRIFVAAHDPCGGADVIGHDHIAAFARPFLPCMLDQIFGFSGKADDEGRTVFGAPRHSGQNIGIFNQSEKRRALASLFDFLGVSPSTRQSATAAAAMKMSQGNAASTAAAISRAVSTPIKPTPWGAAKTTGPDIKITSAPAA